MTVFRSRVAAGFFPDRDSGRGRHYWYPGSGHCAAGDGRTGSGGGVTKARQDVQSLVTALNMYKLDNYQYPSTQQGLEALVSQPSGQPEAPNWKPGGYIDRLPNDPWGRPYQYLNPGLKGEIDVWSFGANGMPGGEGINGEIGNWDS